MVYFYLDTSIWLDFIENRNEYNFPKGDLVKKLLDRIAENGDEIIYSDVVLFELKVLGYQYYEIQDVFEKLKHILVFVQSTKNEVQKAKDLAAKRNVPKKDALHALIARNNRAILVTFDNHFKNLLDIVKLKRPQDII